MPTPAAARATASSPSGWTRRWPAIGAMTSGAATDSPSRRAVVDTADTSTSTRGTSRHRSSARRFSAVVSPPAAAVGDVADDVVRKVQRDAPGSRPASTSSSIAASATPTRRSSIADADDAATCGVRRGSGRRRAGRRRGRAARRSGRRAPRTIPVPACSASASARSSTSAPAGHVDDRRAAGDRARRTPQRRDGQAADVPDAHRTMTSARASSSSLADEREVGVAARNERVEGRSAPCRRRPPCERRPVRSGRRRRCRR